MEGRNRIRPGERVLGEDIAVYDFDPILCKQIEQWLAYGGGAVPFEVIDEDRTSPEPGEAEGEQSKAATEVHHSNVRTDTVDDQADVVGGPSGEQFRIV